VVLRSDVDDNDKDDDDDDDDEAVGSMSGLAWRCLPRLSGRPLAVGL
jgi:hypothetical protein